MEEKMKEVNIDLAAEKPSLAFIFSKKLLEHKKAVEEYLDNGGEFEDIHNKFKLVMPFTAKEFMEQVFPLYKFPANE